MIADEHQHQPAGPAQRLPAAMRAEGVGEFEIRGFPAEISERCADGQKGDTPRASMMAR